MPTWIKASDRLPTKLQFYNCKVENIPTALYCDGEYFVQEGKIIDKDFVKLHLEWLDDPSPLPLSSKEVVGEDRVTRVEVINYSERGKKGRAFTDYDVKDMELQYQGCKSIGRGRRCLWCINRIIVTNGYNVSA